MARAVASWFGTGLILRKLRGSDSGSGTVGSVFAWVIAFLIGDYLGWQAQLVAFLLVSALALWSIRPFTDGDPGWVVIDEAAGAFLAVIGLASWPALVALVVFRMADIFKGPFAVARVERLPGAWGIVADDLVAGLYGLAAGHIVQALV